MAEKTPQRIDREVIRALSHPVRVGILETLRDRHASPAEISAEIGQSLAVVAYHANTLVRCGCLEVVGTAPRDGSVEQYFAIPQNCFASHGDWRRVGDEIRCDVTEATMRSLMDKASKALGLAASDARRRRARENGKPAT